MLHKNQTNAVNRTTQHDPASNLRLISQPDPLSKSSAKPSPLLDLISISSRRCSSFFAEAAVLVLVFGILDFFMLKGRIDLQWIVGALAISLGLLAASIAMDFGAHRWIKAHP
jgi:hypothetical protein